MLKYIVKRLLFIVPIFFGITLIVYFLMSLAPGSPLDAFLQDPRITPMELERMKVELGLDKPIYIQYLTWLKNILKGNLGYSISGRTAVSKLIAERMGATLLLAISSIILSLVIAIPSGILSASKWHSKTDYSLGFISVFLMSTPNFFAGLILIYFLSVKFKLLPSGGMYDSYGEKDIFMLLRHMILPCIVLSIQNIGSWYRQMRNNLLEEINEDYIKFSISKGFSRKESIIKYGVKNAFIPVMTVISISIPGLISGAVVTEQLFGWQGIGTLIITAIKSRDYPVIMGVTVVTSILVLLINLLTDLIYSVIDPRIRYR